MSVHEMGIVVVGPASSVPSVWKPSGALAYRCEAILKSHRTEQWVLTEED